MMVASNLVHLAKTIPSSKLALTAAKPLAVSLAGQLRAFSVKPKGKKSIPVAQPSSLEVSQSGAKTHNAHLLGSVWRDHMQHNLAFSRPFTAGFDDVFNHDPFFAPFFGRGRLLDPLTDMMPVIKKDLGSINSTLLRSSPGYEIKESSSMYEIVIDVPQGIKVADMKVELVSDKTVLHVAGERKDEEQGRVVRHFSFDKHFSIGSNIDVNNLKANLDDGLLVVRAPKLKVDSEEQPQRIPITESPHEMPTDEELVQKSYTDAFDESDWVETGKNSHEKVA